MSSVSQKTAALLKLAAGEINNLRRRNEILAAQVFVVEAFHAASFGAPRGGGDISEDIAWKCLSLADEIMTPTKNVEKE
jgi:hypothetical protein